MLSLPLLADVITECDRQFPVLLHKYQVPGASIALVRDGKLAWAGGYGIKRAGGAEAVSADTVFHAASCSKTVSAYAGLRLYQQGLLDLDAPLNRLVPTAKTDDEGLPDRITLRMALSHSAGLNSTSLTRVALPPGEVFSYASGINYVGKAIEHITHIPFAEYMARNVLGPLGLASSTYALEDGAGVATRHDESGQPFDKVFAGDNPSGSLYTTAPDFARFIAALLAPPADDGFLQPAAITEMLTPQIAITDQLSWGLGWGLNHTSEGDYFWQWGGGHAGNLVLGHRASGSGLVILTNGARGRELWRDIAAIAFGDSRSVAPSLWTVEPAAWHTLQSFHEDLAADLGSAWTRFARRPVEVRAEFTDAFIAADLVEFSTQYPCRHYSFERADTPGWILLSLFTAPVLAMMGRVPPADERVIIDEFAQNLFFPIQQHWKLRGASLRNFTPVDDLARLMIDRPDFDTVETGFSLHGPTIAADILNPQQDLDSRYAMTLNYQAQTHIITALR